MPVRIVEGQLPYTGGTGIEIDANKVISLLLREENNLILVNDDNEIYTDLQLASGLTPQSDFPVGVTTGKVLEADGRPQSGLMLNWKTTSGDYARWIYCADGEIYFDGGNGVWRKVYYSSEVDALLLQLKNYVDLNFQPKLTAGAGITIDANNVISAQGAGTGDVSGPNGAVDGHLAVFDGTTGKAIKDGGPIPTQVQVIDNLTSTSTTSALSANQGKVLNDKIDASVNTKTFFLTGTTGATNIATAQDAIDWYLAGKNPLIMYNDRCYTLTGYKDNGESQWYVFDTSIDITNIYEIQVWMGQGSQVSYMAERTRVNLTDYQKKLTAGSGINIDQNNEISNTGVTSVNNQTGAVTVLESLVKVFSLPQTPGDDMSDIVDWLSAGKVVVFEDGGHYYQVTEHSSSNGEIHYHEINDGIVSTGSEGCYCYIIYYDTVTKELLTTDDTRYLLVPTGGTNGQVLTATSSTAVDWENPTGTTYNAGEGIEIRNGDDYSAMQGPAPDGFHVPSKDEWVALRGVLTTTFSMAKNATTMGTYLKMPVAGYRSPNDASVHSVGTHGYYWSSTSYDANGAYDLYFNSSDISAQVTAGRGRAFSVRCFKDMPAIPTSSWTTLYDGSSVATGAGVFYNATDGLISVSGDGQTWYTIMDKNLGATTVYNQGDTEADANCGYFYQRGNNYGFPHSGTITTTSSTTVDVTGYGPGNYYSSSIFITVSPRNSTTNDNLWGGVTGVVTFDNAITNTGVLVSDQPNNILTSGMKIRAGSSTDYGNLSSYDSNTLYLTVE